LLALVPQFPVSSFCVLFLLQIFVLFVLFPRLFPFLCDFVILGDGREVIPLQSDVSCFLFFVRQEVISLIKEVLEESAVDS
jgi:hypothetical protein